MNHVDETLEKLPILSEHLAIDRKRNIQLLLQVVRGRIHDISLHAADNRDFVHQQLAIIDAHIVTYSDSRIVPVAPLIPLKPLVSAMPLVPVKGSAYPTFLDSLGQPRVNNRVVPLSLTRNDVHGALGAMAQTDIQKQIYESCLDLVGQYLGALPISMEDMKEVIIRIDDDLQILSKREKKLTPDALLPLLKYYLRNLPITPP